MKKFIPMMVLARQYGCTKVRSLKYQFTIFLFALMPCGCGFADGNADLKSQYSSLVEQEKTLGVVTIGQTSIFAMQNSYGGSIQKERDSDGAPFNSLCLIGHDKKGQRYELNLISGAMGGWKIVTAYELSKINEGLRGDKCGKIEPIPVSHWIGVKKEDVIKKIGTPVKSEKDFTKYTSSYRETDLQSNSAFDVYEGIYFYFDREGQVIRIKVFRVEST